MSNKVADIIKIYNAKRDAIPRGCVFVARPSKFGSPFAIGVDGDRLEVIEKFKEYFYANDSLKEAAIKELKGKSLVCYCAPVKCHAEILMEYANAEQNSSV